MWQVRASYEKWASFLICECSIPLCFEMNFLRTSLFHSVPPLEKFLSNFQLTISLTQQSENCPLSRKNQTDCSSYIFASQRGGIYIGVYDCFLTIQVGIIGVDCTLITTDVSFLNHIDFTARDFTFLVKTVQENLNWTFV